MLADKNDVPRTTSAAAFHFPYVALDSVKENMSVFFKGHKRKILLDCISAGFKEVLAWFGENLHFC